MLLLFAGIKLPVPIINELGQAFETMPWEAGSCLDLIIQLRSVTIGSLHLQLVCRRTLEGQVCYGGSVVLRLTAEVMLLQGASSGAGGRT